jgi:hypothetical protein
MLLKNYLSRNSVFATQLAIAPVGVELSFEVALLGLNAKRNGRLEAFAARRKRLSAVAKLEGDQS